MDSVLSASHFFFYVGIILAIPILAFWIYRRWDRNALYSSSKLGRDLSLKEKYDIWTMFQGFFEDEFEDFEDFNDFLHADERTVLIFQTAHGILAGFIILNITRNKIVANRKVLVIKGEFFALSRNFRTYSLPLVRLLLFTLVFKLKNPFEEVYYFFITYSYKSYLSFGRSMGEYYPCHSKCTPPRIKEVLDTLGKEASCFPSEWGTYSPDNCVIKDQYEGSKGRLKLTSSNGISRRVLAMSLEFFLDQNPGHSAGDCFCVVAPVTPNNFFAGFIKAFKRSLSINKKKHNQPVGVCPTVGESN
eukprot:TRINITY_DN7127_c0_g1_i1.p1 TRINITY_DN7127_c0_g1~~TRINITY_DN7127_c0_g1_i1.p1  ORF type:complete len:324 (-),score=39.22 TRINITY_DN7127_c0_g1_i1:23-931(-)